MYAYRGIGDSTGWCVEIERRNGESIQVSENQYLFDAINQFEIPNVREINGECNPFVFFCSTFNNSENDQRFSNKEALNKQSFVPTKVISPVLSPTYQGETSLLNKTNGIKYNDQYKKVNN